MGASKPLALHYEIICAVLEQAHLEGHSLSKWSLTCKSLNRICRRLKFSELDLTQYSIQRRSYNNAYPSWFLLPRFPKNGQQDPLRRFLSLLQYSPDVVLAVRSLRLWITEGLQLNEQFKALLRKFADVGEITCLVVIFTGQAGRSWVNLPSTIRTPIEDMVRSRSLLSLELGRVDDFPVSLLARLTTLRAVELRPKKGDLPPVSLKSLAVWDNPNQSVLQWVSINCESLVGLESLRLEWHSDVRAGGLLRNLLGYLPSLRDLYVLVVYGDLEGIETFLQKGLSIVDLTIEVTSRSSATSTAPPHSWSALPTVAAAIATNSTLSNLRLLLDCDMTTEPLSIRRVREVQSHLADAACINLKNVSLDVETSIVCQGRDPRPIESLYRLVKGIDEGEFAPRSNQQFNFALSVLSDWCNQSSAERGRSSPIKLDLWTDQATFM